MAEKNQKENENTMISEEEKVDGRKNPDKEEIRRNQNKKLKQRGRSKYGTGLRVPGLPNKKFKQEYPGQDPKFVLHPEPRPDPEEVDPEPDDEIAKHKYPPPSKNKIFRKIWAEHIDSLTSRDKFKIGHLNILEILCQLYADCDELKKFIRKHGRSYKSVGRSGVTWKFYPEVAQLTKTLQQIREYTRALNLGPSKDHSQASGETTDEWD